MNIGDILRLKFPGIRLDYQVDIVDEGQGPYLKEWNYPGVSKPSQEILDQWELEVHAEYDLNQILLKRQAEYPSKDDLVVALWEKQIEGRPESADALQTQRLAVKAKYPK